VAAMFEARLVPWFLLAICYGNTQRMCALT
jgi:NADH:ubiquinone oxidoreductase subunit 4 (subunit M)